MPKHNNNQPPSQEQIDALKQKYYDLAKRCIAPVRSVWPHATYELTNPPPSFQVTSWPMFSELTGGFRMREFTILCGATGVGKTSLLANLSANFICQKIPHFVASVETGDEDFTRRVASVLLDVDINDGRVYPKEKVKEWEDSIKTLMDNDILQLSSIDNRMPSFLMLQKLKYAHDELGCKIALLDNLNFFLEVKTSSESIIEMDRVVHDLIMFVKKTEMHVVMVMHPKKTDHGRVESEFDIKGSSTAVQEAHNVFLFNRAKLENVRDGKPKDTARELKAVKLRRRGRYVGKSVIFDGSSPSYRELDLV